MAATRYLHHGVAWRAAGSDAMVLDYDVLGSWAPCIAEVIIIVKLVYEQRRVLWVCLGTMLAAFPGWEALLTRRHLQPREDPILALSAGDISDCLASC